MAAAIAVIYSFVEGFLTVYLLGAAATVLLRFGKPLPSGWLTLAVLVAAYAVAHWKFRRKHGRAPEPPEYAWALICTGSIHVIVTAWIVPRLAIGAGGLIRLWYFVLGVPLLQLAFAIPFAHWLIRRTAPTLAPGIEHDTEGVKSRARRRPLIPVSIAFVSIGTSRFENERREDETVIGGLFAKRVAAAEGRIPQAQVLFVYVELLDDGTIGGLPFRSSIRQIVQLTGAQIVVVASPADAAAIQAAAVLEGPKTANIVFTLNRNRQAFSRFFASLFREMQAGREMLLAWTRLCPQGPAADRPDVPTTILLAEGGKLAFAAQPSVDSTPR